MGSRLGSADSAGWHLDVKIRGPRMWPGRWTQTRCRLPRLALRCQETEKQCPIFPNNTRVNRAPLLAGQGPLDGLEDWRQFVQLLGVSAFPGRWPRLGGSSWGDRRFTGSSVRKECRDCDSLELACRTYA